MLVLLYRKYEHQKEKRKLHILEVAYLEPEISSQNRKRISGRNHRSTKEDKI